MNDHARREPEKVVNIDTDQWSPSQVARYLRQRVDEGDVVRVAVILECREEDEDGVTFERMHSKCTRQELLYLVTWYWRNTVRRYFG